MNNILIKFIMSVAILSGIKPKDLARQFQKGTSGYARELHYYLGKDLKSNE